MSSKGALNGLVSILLHVELLARFWVVLSDISEVISFVMERCAANRVLIKCTDLMFSVFFNQHQFDFFFFFLVIIGRKCKGLTEAYVVCYLKQEEKGGNF